MAPGAERPDVDRPVRLRGPRRLDRRSAGHGGRTADAERRAAGARRRRGPLRGGGAVRGRTRLRDLRRDTPAARHLLRPDRTLAGVEDHAQPRQAGGDLLLQGPRQERDDGEQHGGRAEPPEPAAHASGRRIHGRGPAGNRGGVLAARPGERAGARAVCARGVRGVRRQGGSGTGVRRAVRGMDRRGPRAGDAGRDGRPPRTCPGGVHDGPPQRRDRSGRCPRGVRQRGRPSAAVAGRGRRYVPPGARNAGTAPASVRGVVPVDPARLRGRRGDPLRHAREPGVQALETDGTVFIRLAGRADRWDPARLPLHHEQRRRGDHRQAPLLCRHRHAPDAALHGRGPLRGPAPAARPARQLSQCRRRPGKGRARPNHPASGGGHGPARGPRTRRRGGVVGRRLLPPEQPCRDHRRGKSRAGLLHAGKRLLGRRDRPDGRTDGDRSHRLRPGPYRQRQGPRRRRSVR